MVIHTERTRMMTLVVEIEYVGMIADVVDDVTCSFDGLQLEQVDLKCVHALNKPHLHDIRVVPTRHEVDQYLSCADPLLTLHPSQIYSIQEEECSKTLCSLEIVPTLLLGIYNSMVIHTERTRMMTLVVEIEYVGMIADVVDDVTCSFDGLQLEQVDLKCVHALNKPHLHDIRVVPTRHEVDQYLSCADPLLTLHPSQIYSIQEEEC
nr:hypothetical protein [Tanacetum cinerariifolium]